MSFFNRKEEVLDLELTQHGKKLLSNGKFKPDSYAFFDDDIVYDLRYTRGNAHAHTASFVFSASTFNQANNATVTLVDYKGLSKTYKVKNDSSANAANNEFNAQVNAAATCVLFAYTVYHSSGHDGSIIIKDSAGRSYGGHASPYQFGWAPNDAKIVLVQGLATGSGNTAITVAGTGSRDFDHITSTNIGSAFSVTNKPRTIGKEEQNAAAERVRTTPRIHTQYNFRGIESNIDSPTSIQNIDDSDHYMKLPIGRCSIGSETAPAWNIKYLKNEILSASYVMSGTDMGSGQKFTDLPIPQLSSSITIKSYVEPTDKQVHNEDMYFKQNFKSENTTIKIKDDCLLIQIEEENVPFENENFSIEVYEIIDTDFKGNQILEPLKFFEDPNKPKKYGELYKETEGINKTDYAFNQSYVDYYFDIRVDTEIDQNLLCNYLGEDKVQNIFDVPIKCPDVKKQASIYGSLEQPLGDPCADTDTSSTGNTGGGGGGGY